MSETDEAFASSPLSLSPAARSVWAKSWPQHAASIESWAPLWRHLLDSAACAGRLWDTWLPEAVRSRLASFAGGEASARALCVFAAGVHDIGKATPAFAVQVGALRDEMVDHGLEMPVEIPGIERRRAPHNLAGQVLLGDWLQRRFGWTRRETGGLASVVGAHHGVPPAAEEIVPFLARGGGGLPAASLALLGSQRWQEVQDEILDELVVYLGVGNLLDGKAWTRLPTLAWSLVLSLVVVADWLASNDELFPLTPVGGDRPLPQPDGDETSRIDAAFARLAFPRPWQPRPVDLDVGVLLAERFALPADTAARPVQSAALRAARDLATPGLLIIEAPMGEGKTEAALLAAETFAARVGSGGVFVALPTQATADAMFSRLMAWVSGLPATGAGVGLVPDGSATADPRSVYLAHGKAWLNPDLGRVPHGPSPTRDLGRDVPAAGGPYLDAWMRGPRRGVLADFVVGTIDQVLVAGLQTRHVALRHLSLARKVVVLDEVHSFDAYMGVYLERVLEWLAAFGVPVVALSATLPPTLRQSLVAAYQRGAAVGGLLASAQVAPDPPEARDPEVDLPVHCGSLVTATDGAHEARAWHVEPSVRRMRAHIELGPDDDDEVADLLAERLDEGGCALVVRNTVSRAQSSFRKLRDKFPPGEVVLLHSRFLAGDRKTSEARVVRMLGPASSRAGEPCRPHRLVVVGTQVVEQSLDIDADLLVTDLAPTDLLLQRIGRLHRHARPASDRPTRVSEPTVVVTGVADWLADPVEPDRGSTAVYGEHLLLRAAIQCRRMAADDAGLDLPGDIAPLVAEAYADGELGPARWHRAEQAARRVDDRRRAASENRAATFRLGPPVAAGSLVGWLDGRVGDPEVAGARAQVRESDDSLEVLVVQSDGAGQWRLPDWTAAGASAGAGSPVPMEQEPPVGLVRALAATAVRLPAAMGRGKRGDAVLDALEALMRPAWQSSPFLVGQLVLPLDDDGSADVAGFRIAYDPRLGLTVEESA